MQCILILFTPSTTLYLPQDPVTCLPPEFMPSKISINSSVGPVSTDHMHMGMEPSMRA